MKSAVLVEELPVDEMKERLEGVVNITGTVSGSKEELEDAVNEVEIVITTAQLDLTEDVLNQATSLKLIAKTGTGLDNIDLQAASQNGITVVHTPGVPTPSVAEHALALTLAVQRHVVLGHQTIQEGQWRDDVPPCTSIRDKTVGIVGFGDIGQRIATILDPIVDEIIAHDRSFDPSDTDIELIDADSLYRRADIVMIAVSLNEESRGMVGAEEFKMMNKTAILVNIARGSVVDESALVQALENGQIAGAGLDVFETEPLPEKSGLRETPNTVMTPHIAGAEAESAEKTLDLIAEGVAKFVHDEPIPEWMVAA